MDENIIVRLEDDKVVTATFRKLNQAKKERIYKASLSVFGADVFDRVVLDDIAAAAGISKGSLIQYFTVKENLLIFVSDMALDEYDKFWENYFRHEEFIRAKDRIEDYMLTHFLFWSDNKDNLNFYIKMYYENSLPLSKHFVGGISKIQENHIGKIVERGMQTGEIRRNIRSRHIVFIIKSALQMLTGEFFLDRALYTGTELRSVIGKNLTILFDGIK